MIGSLGLFLKLTNRIPVYDIFSKLFKPDKVRFVEYSKERCFLIDYKIWF